METCPNGAVCKVAVAGVVSVNVSSLSTITRGQHCVTSTNPGLAVSTATPNPGASIGVFLQDAGGAITKARVLLR